MKNYCEIYLKILSSGMTTPESILALTDIHSFSKTIMDAYRHLHDILLGWYFKKLYSGLYKRWIEIIFLKDSPDRPIELKSYIDYFMGEQIHETLKPAVATQIIGIVTILLAVAFVVIGAFWGFSYSNEKFLLKFDKMITLYVLLFLPLKTAYPLKMIRKILSACFGAYSAVIINEIILLACLFLLSHSNRISEFFCKEKPCSGDVSDQIIKITIINASDASKNKTITTAVPTGYPKNCLIEKLVPKLILSFFYMHIVNLILPIAGKNPTMELAFLIFLSFIGYLLIWNSPVKAYDSGILHNYILVYFLSFLTFLVHVFSILVFIFTTLNICYPGSEFIDGALFIVQKTIAPIFSQNRDMCYILAKLSLAFVFILYCIYDGNDDEPLDYDEEVDKYFKTFENLKVYLYYINILTATKVKLIKVMSHVVEFCYSKELSKLLNFHTKVLSKASILKENLLKHSQNNKIVPYLTSLCGSIKESHKSIEKARSEKTCLDKLVFLKYN